MKKMTSLILSVVALVTSCASPKSDLPDGLYADIKTSKGNIIIELEYQKAPVTVANFVSLAEGNNPFVDKQYKDKPYYDGLTFHRVENNFVIQGGDPTGTGSGGPGYVFKDEFDPSLRHDKAGTLSMANSGPFTNGSQFFITHKATPHLDGGHSVFGYTVKGLDIVNTIERGDKMESVKIIRIGKDAKKFNAVKVFKQYFEEADKTKKDLQEKVEKAQKEYADKFAELKAKATKTHSGLSYVITNDAQGKKPNVGQEVMIDYAGFFENGLMFDSSNEELSKTFGTFDQRRADAKQYIPIPFKYGTKTGLIPGFIEGIEQMKIGDKAIIFIPAHLAYGERGAGGVIPPNTDLVFELEMK
ncbi:peptidylprolyl isomerase [Myroides marinus]|uniref:peptidylprolyl isomerase n=1 Tax=Myroides marinus TaxID=703342 RepID=UPI002576C4BD|nr:peptidylprolyl isomerase [Myroides marinus]MDM1367928.1 peptidylprolyl isomerase [Myroides marinus]MDM1377590.1 peptidylprolyl isomerase [Myroides marinus]MDM1382501.1 peptidylprolyl isomerase [Myroides marinus]MDM1384730.1 peptidylprolyl isomerase [Myroides marinus]MDM1392074.1 peptidylprolyl isomerase [Myroides marinus]